MRLRGLSFKNTSKAKAWSGRISVSMWTHFKVLFFVTLFIFDILMFFFLSVGNEENIIILSLVRSSDLGFLDDFRRTNVMLTRCKECLYVCSSWKFLIEGPGSKSLVGRMAAHMGENAWLTIRDIEEDNF